MFVRDKVYVPDHETTGQALQRLRKRAGLPMRGLAAAAGYAHASSIQRYTEPSYAKPLPTDAAQRFVAALVGKGSPPIEASEIYALTGVPQADAATPNAVIAPPMEGASRARMKRDVPIYGTALGADEIVDGELIEQTTLNTGDIIGYRRRPVLLDGRADVYSLYVQGSSMEPRHWDGAVLFVERRRQPSTGDDVVVYLRDPLERDPDRSNGVLVKTLVKKSGSFVELKQYTPAITFRLPIERISRMDRVITLDELTD